MSNAQKLENSATAIVMHWMRDIIEKNDIDLGLPDFDTTGKDRKRPDLVINETRRSKKVLCVIEAKQPYYDVFDEENLKNPAREKANTRRAKYFALLNFKKLIWYSTEKANQTHLSEEQQILGTYNLSNLYDLDDIEQTRYSENIKRRMEEFLLDLYAVHNGKKAEPKIGIDEFLVTQLHEKISLLTNYYSLIIEEKFFQDADFAQRLQNWFAEQLWNFAHQPEDFEKAARQTAYLLVNKILFYNAVRAKRPQEIAPLEIPQGMMKGSLVQKHLQNYFGEVLKIDYENVFSTDFVDELAFPDAREVIESIKEVVALLDRHDFSTLGFDVIGRIFERLIPQEERHNLGQYFTSADVVDLILRFCLKHENDLVLDPSCGAGTFLVRSYQHKKLMNARLKHEKILDTIWGNDIAKFPAHLSIINLAINDLSVDQNYPNIIKEDFFAIKVGKDGVDTEEWRKRLAQTLRVQGRDVIYPRYFDAIVGNPPYTRQEEISEIAPDLATYKEELIESALKDGSEKLADISKRAGIHAYFFVHGWKFLKEGGRFGFIVSNSWLDTDYGRGLQEFFLRHYKIIAIIESKVERWFSEADVNTCIVLLEKCSDTTERDKNLTRFVYLKKRLNHFIPPTSDVWEEQIKRKFAIENLLRTALSHTGVYENDEMRVYPRSQHELWEEGYDEDEKNMSARNGESIFVRQMYFSRFWRKQKINSFR